MKTRALIAWSGVLLLALTAGMTGKEGVYRVRDGKVLSFDEMIRDVKKADLIFIGELHDSREHHRLELEIIRALHESDAPLVIGLEMFRTDSQKTLDAWVTGTLALEQFLPVYYENWRMPWPLYRDIFLYAREHGIPLVGLNISDAISKAISRDGFASLDERQRKQLPPGISCNVDLTYMEFIRRAYSGHEHGSGRQFLNFCEAQMVWDKAMAWHLVGFMKKRPGRTAVVLAGVGHAWRRGIPEQVAQESKYTSRVILPPVPDQVDRETVTPQDADYVVLN